MAATWGMPGALSVPADVLPAALAFLDDAAGCHHANHLWSAVFGPCPDGTTAWLDHLDPADQERLLSALAGSASVPADAVTVTVDGGMVHLRLGERHEGLVAVIATQGAHPASPALDQSARLTAILGGTRAGTWEWNVRTDEFVVDDRWVEMFGWTRDEWCPHTITEGERWLHPDDQARSDRAFERHATGQDEFYECEVRFRHRDGSWIWVLDRGRIATWNSDGSPEWMFGTHVDITALKNQQEQLATSLADLEDARRRIEIATVAGGIGVWEFDMRTMSLTWDAQMYRLYGLTPRHGPMTNETWERCVHPGDLSRLQRETQQAMTGVTGYDTEFRVVHPDGSIRHLRGSATVIGDGTGTPQRFVGVNWDVTEPRLLAEDLAFRASHDDLTQLLNRRHFDIEIEATLGRVRAGAEAAALLFIDLDQFKLVNEACGHQVGDLLLVDVARLIAGNVPAQAVLARLGGDEFGVLLPAGDADRAGEIADKLCAVLSEQRHEFAGASFRVGASVGLVELNTQWTDAQEAIRAADAACYAAKDAGRGQAYLWRDSDVVIRSRRGLTAWASRLDGALDDDGFDLFAQRIEPVGEGKHGWFAEILLRLPDGHGGHFLPGTFLPAAGRYGITPRVDRWVLAHALQVLAETRSDDAGGTQPSLTVNVSAESTGDRSFQMDALAMLRDADPAAVRRLVLEVSESASADSLAAARGFLESAREMGVRVALDDFGSGSSSFASLKALPVDILKIDGTFIAGMVTDPLDDVSVRSFVEVAAVMGLPTVAEQIETPQVLAAVRARGIDFAQGFLLHRPQPLSTVVGAPPNVPRQASAPTAPRPVGS